MKGIRPPPWFNKELKDKFLARDQAYRKWKSSNTHTDETAFKELKADCQRCSREAKANYTEEVINNIEDGNTKKFWNYIKSLKKDSCGVAPLKDNGTLISDAKGKAEVLNRQYTSVFTDEDTSNIPDLGPSPHPPMSDINVTTEGVEKLLKKLNPSKASGPDNIHPKVLKELHSELAPGVTAIFQQSFRQGTVPQQWKTANVTPVFKKGERYTSANYRPVSLTSVLCKLQEHIIAKHLMNHLESKSILKACQHGFRAMRSCASQVINFVQELTTGISEGDQYDVHVMDFSKAFDRVPHARLLKKLEYVGVQGQTLQWIQSFLHGRTQRVVVDGVASEPSAVLSGVPQGSVLGPILFLIFINDLPDYVQSSTKLFADDLILYRKIESDNDRQILQDDLTNLTTWEDKWGMKFHPDKCETIHITRSNNPVKHQYHLRGHPLAITDSTKYLGITINSKLDWKPHIQNTVAKATRTLNFLRRNLKTGSVKAKETSYKTLVRPILEYCSPVWDPYTQEGKKTVESVQRRAARFTLQRYHNTSSVTEMLDQLKWEPLSTRRARDRLTLFYKATNGLIAIDTEGYLIPASSRTRSSHDQKYMYLWSRTNYMKFTFFPRTIPLWNSLPASVVESTNAQDFKANLAQVELPQHLV